MIEWIAFALAELLLPLFYLVQKKLAYPKHERILSAPEVGLAVVYSLLIVCGAIYILFNPSRYTYDNPYIVLVNLYYPAIIYAIYLILAGLVKLAVKHFGKGVDLREYFAFGLYEKVVNTHLHEEWVLKHSCKLIRNIVYKLCPFLLAVTMAVLGINAILREETFALWFAFPICALICVQSLANYLGGPLGAVSQDEMHGEIVKGARRSNFAIAREHLKETFPDALLYDSSSCLPEHRYSPDTTLAAFERAGDMQDLSAAAYFRELASRGFPVDQDYVIAASELEKKKNILIRNPFYQDLGPYLAYPLSQALMNQKKILVLCGGNENAGAIHTWLNSILDQQNRFEDKWKIRELDDLTPDANVGILSYASLYNPEILQRNQRFFEQCEYVVLLHPSRVLTTMQTPLSVLADLVREGENEPVFCVVDQNLNGLSDTIAHVLKILIDADFTMTADASEQTLMIWDADADFQSIERFERQTRFFGAGTEIGAQAISVQVSKTNWMSESRLPVADIQNFAAQNFRSINKVMQVEGGQAALKEKLQVSTSFWDLPRENAEFLILEDEARNPFALARKFASRGNQEVFLNVLSENYLLRDYFCANAKVFFSDPNAVPSLVPDYANTPRNVLLKLILRMLISPLSEHEIALEFDLAGIPYQNPEQTLFSLLHTYTFASTDLFEVETRKQPNAFSRPETTLYFSIRPSKFEEYFSRTLKTANYVLEDESKSSGVLDAKLFSLVLQTILPGQFVNYEGKAYLVKRISPENGVILRRAADLVKSRTSYRQLRRYSIPKADEMVQTAKKSVGGFVFTRYEATISVETGGYLEMDRNGDYRQSRFVDLSIDPASAQFGRTYKNKTLLTIQFPNASQQDLEQTALLMEEILCSVMPEGQPYLSLLAAPAYEDEKYTETKAEQDWYEAWKQNQEFVMPETRYDSSASITPAMKAVERMQMMQGEGLEDGLLYVVEDSDLDLGLLDEFEKYFFSLLGILQDYLRWSLENNEKPADPLDFKAEEENVEAFAAIERRPSRTAVPVEPAEKPQEHDLQQFSHAMQNDSTASRLVIKEDWQDDWDPDRTCDFAEEEQDSIESESEAADLDASEELDADEADHSSFADEPFMDTAGELADEPEESIESTETATETAGEREENESEAEKAGEQHESV